MEESFKDSNPQVEADFKESSPEMLKSMTYFGIKGLMDKKFFEKELREIEDAYRCPDMLTDEEMMKEMKDFDSLIEDIKNVRTEVQKNKTKIAEIPKQVEDLREPYEAFAPKIPKMNAEQAEIKVKNIIELNKENCVAKTSYEKIRDQLSKDSLKLETLKKQTLERESRFNEEYEKYEEMRNFEYNELLHKYNEENIEDMMKDIEEYDNIDNEIEEFLKNMEKTA